MMFFEMYMGWGYPAKFRWCHFLGWGGSTGGSRETKGKRTKTPNPEGLEGLNGRLLSRGGAPVPHMCACARARLNYMRAGELIY